MVEASSEFGECDHCHHVEGVLIEMPGEGAGRWCGTCIQARVAELEERVVQLWKGLREAMAELVHYIGPENVKHCYADRYLVEERREKDDGQDTERKQAIVGLEFDGSSGTSEPRILYRYRIGDNVYSTVALAEAAAGPGDVIIPEEIKDDGQDT